MSWNTPNHRRLLLGSEGQPGTEAGGLSIHRQSWGRDAAWYPTPAAVSITCGEAFLPGSGRFFPNVLEDTSIFSRLAPWVGSVWGN